MIVTTTEFYRKAFASDYALGGFQAYNMEMVQGIIEACAEERSPALVQSSCRGIRYAGEETIYQIARIWSDKFGIPVALHLDHGDSIELCKRAIDAGFSSVMLDNTDLPFETQAERTREVVAYAHTRGAVVEGEIAMAGAYAERWRTCASDAKRFVEYTGCDSLSICVGNSHALYGRGFPEDQQPHLHFNVLSQIHNALPNTPLVLHSVLAGQPPELARRLIEAGGQKQTHFGFDPEEIHLALRLGVVKCNVGIDKIAMTVGIREYLRQNPETEDPRKYMQNGKDVMKWAIRQQMKTLFHSSGRL